MELMSKKDLKDPMKIADIIFDFDIAREWLLTDVTRADL